MDLAGLTPKISFFEMVASDSLYSYFEGGFKYIYSVVTGHYDSLTPIRYYADEAYLIFDLLLESYYLYKHNSLYSENFFSFTRSAMSFTDNSLKTFSGKHKILVLIYEVILPYLRLKLNKWHQEKKQNPVNLPFDRKYLPLIPLMNGGYTFIDFLYKLKFLVQGDFKFFRPYLHFWNFLIRRKNIFELQREEKSYSHPALSFFAKYNVFLIFLFVKFCQWYFNQDNVNRSVRTAGSDVCPPPKKLGRFSTGCPLCKKQNIENPWALETSGYVYCFVWIQEFVEKHKKCPISNVATTESNIRKIYT
jgi:peroxin-12